MNCSAIQYLKGDKELIPSWLENHKRGFPIQAKEILKSRVCFYPGSGFDGTPIELFNKSHSCHVYVYTDYLIPKNDIEAALDSDNAFVGYELYDTVKISLNDLIPNGFIPHISKEEFEKCIAGYNEYNVDVTSGYVLLKIFERRNDFTSYHGAKRFAILYIGGDAIATYDALFGNKNANVFSLFIKEHGFGCQYEHYGVNTLLERIAERTNAFPKYIVLFQRQYMWKGYSHNREIAPYFKGTEKFFVYRKD